MTTEYQNLPKNKKKSDLEKYFNEFLSVYSGQPKDIKALKQLYELAYRQWDTYEKLNEELLERVSDYVMDAIDFNNFKVMDTILSIVENLTMKRVFDHIVQNKDSVTLHSVKQLIEEAYEEYGDMSGDLFDDLDDW